VSSCCCKGLSRQSEPSAKRFKYQYTTEQKCWLVDFTENNPKLGAEDLGQKLAEHVNAGRARDQLPVEPPKKNTVNDWRRDRVALRAKLHTSLARGGKRDKKAKYPELEEALQLWFKQQEQRGLTVQDEHFRGQAIRFAEGLKIPVTGDNAFSFSNGWLDGFKKRKGIKSFVQHGEAGSANAAGIELARRSVRKLVEGLDPGDIFNQDESSLFWRQPPSQTLSTGKKAGRKKDEQRVTASLLVNATGTEKLPLFLIGKAKRPRSFPKNFQPKRDLNVRYANNRTSWMTTSEFSCYMLDWNAELKRCALFSPLWVLDQHSVHGHRASQVHAHSLVTVQAWAQVCSHLRQRTYAHCCGA
jgi:hypothetical protein